MIGPVSQTHAAALYVALVRDGESAIAQDFARWWFAVTATELQTTGYAGVNPEWDADELGIDEDDLPWP